MTDEQKRLALTQKLMRMICEGVGDIVDSDDPDVHYGECCDILLLMILALPRKYRTGMLWAATQVWNNEVEHDPALLQAVTNASKDRLQ
jgi:hypothetical protein